MWAPFFTETNMGEISEWVWTGIDGSDLFGTIQPKTNQNKALDIWQGSCKSATCKVGTYSNHGSRNQQWRIFNGKIISK